MTIRPLSTPPPSVGQQVPSKATTGQVHGPDGSGGSGAAQAGAEEASDAIAREAAAATVVEEAAATVVVKEFMAAAVAQEATSAVAMKEALDATSDPKVVTEKTVTMIESSGASDSGPRAT
jgi:hypothetical protein